jgi:hypothetical protein
MLNLAVWHRLFIGEHRATAAVGARGGSVPAQPTGVTASTGGTGSLRS